MTAIDQAAVEAARRIVGVDDGLPGSDDDISFLDGVAVARALLAAAEREQWLPIDSAPKDGTPLLLYKDATGEGSDYSPPYCVVGHWDLLGYEPSFRWKACAGREIENPTHYRPLPLPPRS